MHSSRAIEHPKERFVIFGLEFRVNVVDFVSDEPGEGNSMEEQCGGGPEECVQGQLVHISDPMSRCWSACEHVDEDVDVGHHQTSSHHDQVAPHGRHEEEEAGELQPWCVGWHNRHHSQCPR
eukprot:scaffold207_cov345-Pavlova_lutheri.AAC.6